jgi:3-hydroxybutyryl-CoA dehydrogenase
VFVVLIEVEVGSKPPDAITASGAPDFEMLLKTKTLRADIKKIAVIGAGERGRGIAALALNSGFDVVLEDVASSRLEEAAAWIRSRMRLKDVGALATSSDVMDAIRDAELIVETTADEWEMKWELFTIFDKFAGPGAIFASASEMSIGEMSELTVVRERCVGMRFGFEGVQTLEIVKTALTSSETVDACVEVGRRMGLSVTITEEVGQ